MNVKTAIRQAAQHGLTVRTVVANDDVPSAPAAQREQRRGVAGEILSIGIGLSACTVPAVGKLNFTIENGKMEVGIGPHGEPGISVETLRPARAIAELMPETVLPDLPFVCGDDVAMLVSGLGATPIMELRILYDRIAEVLEGQGMRLRHQFVGDDFTSLEMKGATLTVMRPDAELDRLMVAPARSVGLTRVAS